MALHPYDHGISLLKSLDSGLIPSIISLFCHLLVFQYLFFCLYLIFELYILKQFYILNETSVKKREYRLDSIYD